MSIKVLVVCSYNQGRISPFISEQVESLRKSGVSPDYFFIQGKGALGYLKNLPALKCKLLTFKPDIIHAHYGLSGLLCNFQRKIPVITTFHGSDINHLYIKPFSILASWLSRYSIFISKELACKSLFKRKFSVIPCGVDLNIFHPVNKMEARRKLSFRDHEKLVLFSGSFTDRVKNYPLAKAAFDTLENIKLVELRGYSREEVNLLLNACDAALLTSFHEGSPQFIKEAMACNRPIVSTSVGDVKRVIGTTKGCYISRHDKTDISDKLKIATDFAGETDGRQQILCLEMDLETISGKILKLYQKVLNN
jgi:teichuronic acid biosynthesis glycosyltransferase TuaC